MNDYTCQNQEGNYYRITPLKHYSKKILKHLDRDRLDSSQFQQLNISRGETSEPVFASDLRNHVNNFKIQDQFKDHSSSPDFKLKIPLKPIQVYNCLTDTVQQYKPPDMIVHHNDQYDQHYQRLLKHDKAFNKKLGFFAFQEKNKQYLQQHLRNNQTFIEKSDIDYENSTLQGECSKLQPKFEMSPEKKHRSISQAKIRTKRNETNRTNNNESSQYMQSGSIHEKSFKNLIGSENKLQSLKYFFKKKKENFSVDPRTRQRHQFLNSSQLMMLEQMEDFHQNQHQTSQNEYKEMDEFNDKFGKSASKVTNIFQMKLKYKINDHDYNYSHTEL